MIDGTFMKGKHRGILLSAMGKDRNEGKLVYFCSNTNICMRDFFVGLSVVVEPRFCVCDRRFCVVGILV